MTGELPVDESCDLPDGSGQWIARAHTPDEMSVAFDFMTHGLPVDEADRWPIGLRESVTNIKLITDDLHAAGLRVSAGGGKEQPDHVRTLLVMRDRIAKIAEWHQKRVDAHGGTFGDCAECSLPWPCPTFDWARETSDRDPVIDCWDRADD